MKRYNLAEKIIGEDDLHKLAEWLKTNPRLTKDKLTLEFEKKWADWIGTKYAIFCNSGSSANLLIAYAALISGKLKNKKVIVPSVGWVTTVAPFIQFGYEPIMCGADKDNFGMDLNELETLVQKYNPGSVIYVQVLGVPGNMDQLKHLQQRYGFMLMEDACATYGAEYDGKKIGSFGDMSSISLFFGHQLSTIEGGMVNTNDENLYNLLLMLRSHGWGKDFDIQTRERLMKIYEIDNWHEPFTFFIPGFNLRATEINAFLGLEMMKKANEVMAVRKRNHLVYTNNLYTVDFQRWDHKTMPCSISLGALAKNPEHRMAIVKKLDENNIETRLFSAGNLGLHPFWYERYGKFHHQISDKIHDCGFFLPNNESMTEDDVRFICDIVNNIKLYTLI